MNEILPKKEKSERERERRESRCRGRERDIESVRDIVSLRIAYFIQLLLAPVGIRFLTAHCQSCVGRTSTQQWTSLSGLGSVSLSLTRTFFDSFQSKVIRFTEKSKTSLTSNWLDTKDNFSKKTKRWTL